MPDSATLRDDELIEHNQMTDDEWYTRMQTDRQAKLDEAELKEIELFDRSHPDFITSAYDIIHEDEVLVPGTSADYIFYGKLEEPTYKNALNDFKAMRNKLRYGTGFIGNIKQINAGVRIQVVQLEWAWLSVLMKAADRGTMAGPHRPYSYHWIFTVWKLYLQVKDRLAEKHWRKAQKEDDSLDLSMFYSAYVRGDYTYLFLQWFCGIVRKASDEDKVKLQKTLFPRAWLGPLATKKMYGTGPKLEVKDTEKDGQAIVVATASMEDLLSAFGRVDLNAVEKEEEKEEARLATLDTDSMEVDG